MYIYMYIHSFVFDPFIDVVIVARSVRHIVMCNEIDLDQQQLVSLKTSVLVRDNVIIGITAYRSIINKKKKSART